MYDDHPEPTAGERLTVLHHPGTSIVEVWDPEDDSGEPIALPQPPASPSLADIDNYLLSNRFRRVGPWRHNDAFDTADIEFLGFAHDPTPEPGPHPDPRQPAIAHQSGAAPMTTRGPLVLVVEPRDHEILDLTARALYDAPLHPDLLPRNHAIELAINFTRRAARRADARVHADGHVVAIAALDGPIATSLAADRRVSEVESWIDDHTPLTITVTQSIWQRLTRRRPIALHWDPER